MGVSDDRRIGAGVVKLLEFKHGWIFVDEFASIASTDNGLCVAQDYAL